MTMRTRSGRRFLGRQDALDELARFAADPARSLVSVVGPGGVGKTTLVFQLGWDLVDLSACTTLAEGRQALTIALNGELPQAVRGRTDPLVLDNLEQLEGAAELVQGCLDAGARIVATSRTPLFLPREEVLRLEPLSTRDGVALFADRGAGSAEDPRVRDIVERLDGLPLAIELAAGRSGFLGLDVLRQQVESSLGALATRRAETDRHATLRACLAWSWQLLDPDARGALAACTAFEGTFDLPAARHVIGGDQAEQLLEALVDHSLVRVPAPGRFALLASVRLFAEPHRDEAASARHEAWITDERFVNAKAGEVTPWLADLERVAARHLDGGDLRVAARALVVAADAHLVHGVVQGRRERFDRLLDAGVLDDEWTARVRCSRAALRFQTGDPQGAVSDYDAAIAVVGDGVLAEVARVNLGMCLARTGDLDRAQAEVERAAQALSVMPQASARRRALAWSSLAVVRHARGDTQGSRDAFLQAYEQSPDADLAARSICNVGFMDQALGRPELARAAYERALELQPPTTLPMLRVLFYLGTALHELGRLDEAVDAYRRAADGQREMGGRRDEGEIALAAACAERQRGRPDAEWILRSDAAWAAQPSPRADDLRAAYRAASGDGPMPQVEIGAAAELRFPMRLAQARRPALRVGPQARWFELHGQRVDLGRRAAMRRILEALAAARRDHPGVAVSRDEVFARGWPGESIAPDSAAHRARVAISSLRKLGLEPVLIRQDDGWLLRPDVPISD